LLDGSNYSREEVPAKNCRYNAWKNSIVTVLIERLQSSNLIDSSSIHRRIKVCKGNCDHNVEAKTEFLPTVRRASFSDRDKKSGSFDSGEWFSIGFS